MTVRLSTTVRNIERNVSNDENVEIILQFFEFMKKIGTSERYQNNNLKAIIAYSKFLGPSITLYQVKSKSQITSFLDTRIKAIEEDPDKRWITTWNDYLGRIKYFFRWLHNYDDKRFDDAQFSDWQTPDFVRIKKKKTKRISPYLENELWEKEDLLTIIKYEPHKRNKAILSLLWDLDARPHEITLLKIKHIRLKEKYGEGEIPHDAKTGTGPILLTMSFPYVRDWLNEHPFKNEPEARLICNLNNGSHITTDAIDFVLKQLRERIVRLLHKAKINNENETEKLEYLIKTKKWNAYCIRHSAITADSDYLPEYALKKKVRWSMNSKQGIRYIKRRMGNDLKQKILEYNGVISPEESKRKPSILNCPRCYLVNAMENKYCSKCSYPLVPSAFEEIKMMEEMKINSLKEKHERDMEEVNQKLDRVMSMVQQNPKLAHAKPDALVKVENLTS
jgi:integrase/recombinase XerD